MATTSGYFIKRGVRIQWTPADATDHTRLLEWHRGGELRLRERRSRGVSPKLVKACGADEARVWAKDRGWVVLFDAAGGFPVVPILKVIAGYANPKGEEGLVKREYGKRYEKHMRRLTERAAKRLPLFGRARRPEEPEAKTVCDCCGVSAAGAIKTLRACGWARREIVNMKMSDWLCPACFHEYGWGELGGGTE